MKKVCYNMYIRGRKRKGVLGVEKKSKILCIYGRELKKWREKNNLSQYDIAKMCNTTPTTVYRWESGMVIPRAKQIEKLLRLKKKFEKR